jgi:hypothetical protein
VQHVAERRWLNAARSMQAFTLTCEFMYTGQIDALEDAEVAINVWMVSAALCVRGVPDYVYSKIQELLPGAPLHLVPGVVRQALAAAALGETLSAGAQAQSGAVLQAVMELLLCKLQARRPLFVQACRQQSLCRPNCSFDWPAWACCCGIYTDAT